MNISLRSNEKIHDLYTRVFTIMLFGIENIWKKTMHLKLLTLYGNFHSRSIRIWECSLKNNNTKKDLVPRLCFVGDIVMFANQFNRNIIEKANYRGYIELYSINQYKTCCYE